jgi:hypothetical protein
MLRRLALWMAKRYLKTRHYRLSGFIGTRVLASGDLLVSPRAVKILHALKGRQLDGCENSVCLLEAPAVAEFIGIEPPHIRPERIEA